MTEAERILAYVGFTDDRPFSDYLLHVYRFWEGSFRVIYHVVITTERVIVVRMSNPFDSFLFGPLLLDGIFYFPRLRWFRDRVLEGKLEKALETNLKKWIYPRSSVARLDYDRESFVIRLRNGRARSFRFTAIGGRPNSLGGDFPHKSDLHGAAEAFNRLSES